MGLDILIRSDKNIYTSDIEEFNYRNKHSLSRTFCNLMCRKNVVSNTELDQIGKIIGISISHLYEMGNYDEDLERIEYIDSEEEKKLIISENNKAREKLNGNINFVISLINDLIDNLSKISNLAYLLTDNDFNNLDNKVYFSEFNKNKGDGYIDNNFGQDLRNLIQFLEFAKERGAKTVWFSYG